MSQRVESERLYREGVAAIRTGDKATARTLLSQAVELDQTNEQAWLWLSAAVEDVQERIICLENVLTLNPHNEAARLGLEKLGRPVPAPAAPAASPAAPTYAPAPSPPAAWEPTSSPEPTVAQESEARPTLEHASSRVAEMLSQLGERKKQDDSGDSWRKGLYDPDMESQGAYGKFVRERPIVKPGILDLFNLWGNMLWFNLGEDFENEVRHGNIWHIPLNITAASIISGISSILFVIVLSTLFAGGNQPRLFESVYDSMIASSGGDPAVAAAWNDVLASFRQATGGLILRALIYAVINIPIAFIVLFFRGWVIDFVAGLLGGKGDVIQTLHAITLAAIVSALAQLPVMFLLPFLPVGAALLVYAGIGLYPFVVEALAVSKVHKFGLFASFGTLILSGLGLGVLSGGLLCLLSSLLAAG